MHIISIFPIKAVEKSTNYYIVPRPTVSKCHAHGVSQCTLDSGADIVGSMLHLVTLYVACMLLI